MPGRHAIVVVIDRFGAGWSGPYGNTWLDTPAINQLAAQSVLWETAIIDSPDLASVYRSYWQGTHALARAYSENARVPFETDDLPRRLAKAGLESSLVTDDLAVSEHPLARGFDRQIAVPRPDTDRPAADAAETELAALFAAAIHEIQQASAPGLIWTHARGMSGAWDAPWPLRAQFADEDDPPPPDFVTPPEQRLAEHADPDWLLGLAHAYAGQVVVLDHCLSALLAAIESSPLAATTLLAFTSPRGYPLGEHGRVGACDHALCEELVHVPLLVRLPGGERATERRRDLVQPWDLPATLADWFGVHSVDSATLGRSLLTEPAAGPSAWRDRAAIIGETQRAVRTPAWYLRDDPAGRPELFAKPDDRWEVNEVANRCRDVVELLQSELEWLRATFRDPSATSAPRPLSDVLMRGLD